jgi:uncharacterized protein YqjF (DUF2071 family)
MARPFLTARWSNLCLVTYAVPPELLRPRLPPGLELDMRDGRAFVSLVAFDFLQTRVRGVSWPWHFPEINLRFYVRQGQERGVVFIREFIPSRFVAWAARTLYNEPYRATPMTSRIEDGPSTLTAAHELLWQGRTHSLSVTGDKPGTVPAKDSIEHFFKEHRWGFGTDRRGRLICYEVEHPTWMVYPVRSFEVRADFGSLYGAEWAFLIGEAPYSVVLAEGSRIAVYPKGRQPLAVGASPP